MSSFSSSCTCTQLDAIFRHGTRYPSLKYIQNWDSFQALLESEAVQPRPPTLGKTAASMGEPFH